jgi:hypothetical protein
VQVDSKNNITKQLYDSADVSLIGSNLGALKLN